MPKLFLAVDYLGNSKTKHKENVIIYVSETSKGVARHTDNFEIEKSKNDVTDNQKRLIDAILEFNGEFFKSLQTYESYKKNPNSNTAYDFIQEANELYDFEKENEVDGKLIYLKYVRERKGVEKHEGLEHGLFDKNGIADPDYYAEFASKPNTRMYRIVLSLNKEDAKDVNLTTLDEWQKLCQKVMPEVLKIFGCSNQKTIDWNGAFHSKQSQPHVHINILTDDLSVFLDNKKSDDVDKIKRLFVKAIYPKLFENLNLEKNKNRLEFEKQFAQEINEIMSSKSLKEVLPDIKESAVNLTKSLLNYHGRKYYQYIPFEAKREVDKLVYLLTSLEPINDKLNAYIDSIVEQMKLYKSEIDKDGNVLIDRELIRNSLIFPEANKSRSHVLHNKILKSMFENKSIMLEVLARQKRKEEIAYHQLLRETNGAITSVDIEMMETLNPIIENENLSESVETEKKYKTKKVLPHIQFDIGNINLTQTEMLLIDPYHTLPIPTVYHPTQKLSSNKENNITELDDLITIDVDDALLNSSDENVNYKKTNTFYLTKKLVAAIVEGLAYGTKKNSSNYFYQKANRELEKHAHDRTISMTVKR